MGFLRRYGPLGEPANQNPLYRSWPGPGFELMTLDRKLEWWDTRKHPPGIDYDTCKRARCVECWRETAKRRAEERALEDPALGSDVPLAAR